MFFKYSNGFDDRFDWDDVWVFKTGFGFTLWFDEFFLWRGTSSGRSTELKKSSSSSKFEFWIGCILVVGRVFSCAGQFETEKKY